MIWGARRWISVVYGLGAEGVAVLAVGELGTSGGGGPKSSGEGRIRSLFAYMYIFKILNITQNIEDIIHT
jgi:hypothetical protein